MTEIVIHSAPIIDPLAKTSDVAIVPTDEMSEVVGEIDVLGRIHKFRTCEIGDHMITIRIERGRLKSATGPGLEGIAEEITALKIVNALHNRANDIYAGGTGDHAAYRALTEAAIAIHKGEGWR